MRKLFVLVVATAASLFSGLASAKAYKGAEVYSNQSYTYGRYEVRMRVAKASGTLSTFFTYKNGSEIGNTFWEEIDIEVFGKNNASQWQTNIITGSSRPTVNTEQVHTANSSLGDDYHTYVVEWTPDYVAWFLDGVETRRINGTSTVTSLTGAESLRFNIWASESVAWVGPWDDSALPVYQFVNYIDYKAYNATTKQFEGGWRDDFDSFDASRWSKANWTFDTNRVDFAPENVVVKNGVMVLALTRDNATGYAGTPPADDSQNNSSAASASSKASSASSAVASSAASASSEASSVASSAAASSSSSTEVTTPSKSGGGGGGAMDLWLLALCSLLLISRKKA